MIDRRTVGLLLGLALGACGTDAPEPTGQAPTEPSEEAPELAADDAEEIAPEDFPIPEDFEDEAETEITADNLEAELAALESELDEPEE